MLRIAAYAVLGAIVLGAYTYFSASVWRASSAIVMPPEATASNSGLAALGMASNPLLVIKGILDSESASDYVAAELKMSPVAAKKMLSTAANVDSNQVRILTVAESKDVALKANKLFLERLAQLAAKTGFSLAQDQAAYLEQALKDRSADLAKAEEELKNFQAKSLTVPDPTNPFSSAAYRKEYDLARFQLGKVEEQISVAMSEARRKAGTSIDLPGDIPNAKEWRDRLQSAEYELRVAEINLGPEAPQVVALRKKLDVTRQALTRQISQFVQSVQQTVNPQVADLQAQRMVLQWQTEYNKRLADAAPQEAIQYQRLLREVQTRATIVAGLRTQFEASRVNAQVDRARYTVLVDPYLEPKPINKRYTLMVAVGLILGALVGALAAIRRGLPKFVAEAPRS